MPANQVDVGLGRYLSGALSPATIIGPLWAGFCHEHGTTWLPVMGPLGVSRRGA
jgi:hypothetical protein